MLNPKYFPQKLSILLFDMPKSKISKTRLKNTNYDTFYHITAPEGYTIDYKIDKAVHVESDGTEKDIEIRDQISDGKIVYIRTPSAEKPTKFEMTYHVVLTNNDKRFYSIIVLSTIIFSAVVLFSNLDINLSIPEFLILEPNSHISNILPTIKANSDILYAGIFSGSIAAIGFMKGFALRRTRFWWILPMIISAVGFLLVK